MYITVAIETSTNPVGNTGIRRKSVNRMTAALLEQSWLRVRELPVFGVAPGYTSSSFTGEKLNKTKYKFHWQNLHYSPSLDFRKWEFTNVENVKYLLKGLSGAHHPIVLLCDRTECCW